MRENIIFYTGSRLKCWSQYMLNGGNSGQIALICSLITISLFGIIFAWNSKVASLTSRLLMIISVARDMRCMGIILK